MKKALKIIGTTIGIVAAVVWFGLFVNMMNREAPTTPTPEQQQRINEHIVGEVCLKSSQVSSGDLENYCGELQDKHNIKFLCDETSCWTESIDK